MLTDFQCMYPQLRLLDALLGSGQVLPRAEMLGCCHPFAPRTEEVSSSKKMGYFVLHPVNTGFVELTSGC